jgi:hypothetical protein
MKNHKGPPIKYVFCMKKIKKREKREKKRENERR